MKTIIRPLWILVSILVFLSVTLSIHAQMATPPFLPSDADGRCRQWVDSVLSGLSLHEKVGQLIVATIPAKADEATKKRISECVKKYKVGGLLFSEGTPEEQAILTNIARKEAKVPVMITFDGEWGLSMRLKGSPEYPRNAALGCIEDNSLIEEYGREVARQLHELGVHVNFAPVADVNTNPSNPVIHVRSFGENPYKVAEKVVAYSRGLESGGILSVCKHFPGHGDTDVDSHKALPTLYYDRARLDSIELYPFKEMVREGLGGVMVGHLRVPALEPDRITSSSLSRSVVTGLLKDELGFKGLVFTDALDMKGVSMVPQVTTKALLAGNDMLLSQFNVRNAVHELTEAVASGRLSKKELDGKCRKVLTYKYLLGLRKHQPPLQVSGMSYRIDTEEARALATKLRCSAVTVLNNEFDVLPLASTKGDIAILSIGKKDLDIPFAERMKKYAGIVRFYLPWNADEAAKQFVAHRLTTYRRVIISINGATNISGKDVSFLEKLNLPAPLVYTFFTSYRTLQPMTAALAKSSAVILAHSAEADVQEYVADVLFAKKPAGGKLSMSIGELFPAGTGCVIEPGMTPVKVVPEDYGLKSYVLKDIDGIVLKGLAAGAYPGCRVLVWKNGQPIYDKGFGTHSDKDTATVRPSDLFDLASMTKTTATLLAVMKLYDEGKIKLDGKLSAYLPFLHDSDKRNITIRELLLHQSGLPAYIRFYQDLIDPNTVHGPYSQSWQDKWHRTRISEHSYYCSDFSFKEEMVSRSQTPTHSLHMADSMWLNKDFKHTILRQIAKCRLNGKRYVYSDLGFVLLQQVVEAVSGLPMDAYLAKEFYAPMGLQRTMFLPLNAFTKAEIMPTAANDFLRRQDICGYVHDETAACMGGVSGNAGLFSTAEEVAKIYQMLLDGGEFGGKRFLSEAACRLFTTEKSAISRRGLGFDRPDTPAAKSNPCAPSAPKSVYGHTGFTGTCVWVDPDNRLIYIFLSNRLCHNVWNTKLGDMHIRKDIQELIYKALSPSSLSLN